MYCAFIYTRQFGRGYRALLGHLKCGSERFGGFLCILVTGAGGIDILEGEYCITVAVDGRK